MAFFKRIEVWVLLALTVAGVVAVLRMDKAGDRGVPIGTRGGSDGSAAAGGDGPGGASRERHRIESLNLERDGDHAVVEILVWVDEAFEIGGESANRAKLLRADGSQVPPFFVPFHDAEKAAGTVAKTTPGPAGGNRLRLLFWADEAALAGELFLELRGGERIEVKGADGFQLETVEDGARRELITVKREGGSAS